MRFDAAGVRTLVTTGVAETVVYGVPLGKLCYKVEARGKGKICLRAICNRSATDLIDCETLAELSVDSCGFAARVVQVTVPDAPETAYETHWEGLSEKVMGRMPLT